MIRFIPTVKKVNLVQFSNFSIVLHVDPISVTTLHDIIDLELEASI